MTLILGCSARKVPTPGRIPALNRYDGYFFRIVKKQGLPPDWEVAIFSAKYGLIPSRYPIPDYDQTMTLNRAALLHHRLQLQAQELMVGREGVLICAGKLYRDALLRTGQIAPPFWCLAGGIGEQGHQLKLWLQGNEA